VLSRSAIDLIIFRYDSPDPEVFLKSGIFQSGRPVKQEKFREEHSRETFILPGVILQKDKDLKKCGFCDFSHAFRHCFSLFQQ